MPNRVCIAALALGAAMACTFARPASAQSGANCPAELPAQTRCFIGKDGNGAHYWIALPAQWNGVLVVHAHGGPRLAPVDENSSVEDLVRFSVIVEQGFAWAGSSYRRPGYGVRMAAEDTENLRQIFVKTFGRPKRTLMHGQSWGGNVAAKGIELYANNGDGTRNYDGALITSGLIAGATRAYLHRADLRSVYQYYCNNHPRSDEPAYPLWMGLPADSKMTAEELAARVNECTGAQLPAAQRSDAQRRKLADIAAVIRIPESSLLSHLDWATFMFRDLVQLRLGGRNPFSNRQVEYRGSSDDKALNAGVARFDADQGAVAELARDGDLTGKVSIPILTMHAVGDPTAFVEHEAAYRDTLIGAGTQASLVQTFTSEALHSKLATPQYAATLQALMEWIDSGTRPTPQHIANLCAQHARKYPGGCHYLPEFKPQPFFWRAYPRSLPPRPR